MKRCLHRIFFLFICTLVTACASNITYSQRSDVEQFIHKMSVQHNFDQAKLTQLFDQVQPNPKIIATMTTPHEGLPWYRYRALFLKADRAQAGANFWRLHATTLAAAQKKYGVPPEIIIAILGVETNYGHFLGTYSVLDALATLAFDYPPRATYFKSELEQYLLLSRENCFDPLALRGSYAGAIGQPQFMPSSYRQYAVDATGKGYSDLFGNSNDVIFSVARYFKAHGWQAGQPIVIAANVKNPSGVANLTSKNKFTLDQFKNKGVLGKSKQPVTTRGYLLTLEGSEGPLYWIALPNFEAIMRYNTSPLYAMAVTEMSEWIKKDYLHKGKKLG